MLLRALLVCGIVVGGSGCTEAQDLPHARTLFADSVSVPPFPYQEEADSLLVRFTRDAAEAYVGDSTFIHPPEPQINFSAVLDNGRTVGTAEYFDFLRDEFPPGPICFVGLTVEWNGVISSARVVTCRRGDIPNEVLIPAVRRLRAEVVDYGFGRFPVQWSFPFVSPRRQ